MQRHFAAHEEEIELRVDAGLDPDADLGVALLATLGHAVARRRKTRSS